MDWVGCQGLPRAFDRELRAGGVEVQRFRSSWGRIFRFQLKFRNHRKIMVVDGLEGWIGGLNVGDEYRGWGRGSRIEEEGPDDGHAGGGARTVEPGRASRASRSSRVRRPWRDTHLYLRGPAAQDLQQTFVGDWFWATGTEPDGLVWGAGDPAGGSATYPAAADGLAAEAAEAAKADVFTGVAVTVVPAGPADRVSATSLTLLDAIHRARDRLWITTAYFVPDAPLVAALQLAALRGVDVRVLVPLRGDLGHMDRLSFAYFEDLLRVGVRIFRYANGVLHAKTAVIDDQLAWVGTANLDPRSLYLNFEVTALLHDAAVAAQLAGHMEDDLLRAVPLTAEDLGARSLSDRLLTRILYLMSPAL
jgi:cardiolipin synthase A/B